MCDLQISFRSEMMETMTHMHGAAAVIQDMTTELGQTKAESLELQVRGEEGWRGRGEEGGVGQR